MNNNGQLTQNVTPHTISPMLQLYIPLGPPAGVLVVQCDVPDERLVVAGERRVRGHHVRGRRVFVPAHRAAGDPRRLCGAEHEGGFVMRVMRRVCNNVRV